MFSLGGTTIVKVQETTLTGFAATKLIPDMPLDLPATHPQWFPEETIDAAGQTPLSMHSWLVRHRGMVLLVDTGIGNAKQRPQAVMNGLDNPYLERLAAAGVAPEDVDYILHTHLDHVGWNTVWQGGTWRPTFPNATIICSLCEWRYAEALTSGYDAAIANAQRVAGLGLPGRVPDRGPFEDSLLPIHCAGAIRLIEVSAEGEEVLPGLRFLPTPGHSIDHAAIELSVDGKVAIFGGDVAHHPVEIYDTNLLSSFCEFPEAARRSRTQLLNRAVDADALYFSARFPLSSAGRVTREGGQFAWRGP